MLVITTSYRCNQEIQLNLIMWLWYKIAKGDESKPMPQPPGALFSSARVRFAQLAGTYLSAFGALSRMSPRR
jgi:hypothetical protein